MENARWVKLYRGIFFAVVLLIFSSLDASALEVAGVDVPQTVNVANNQLVLNGAGIRKKFFFKIYVGALYLTTKGSNINAILADTGPKSIVMTFLYKEVETEKLVDGWNEGFANNSSAREINKLKERINRFNRMFVTVHRGDVIRLDYLPDKGTQVMINSTVKGIIEGEDFSRALLKIWLGQEPADSNLKDAMLGNAY